MKPTEKQLIFINATAIITFVIFLFLVLYPYWIIYIPLLKLENLKFHIFALSFGLLVIVFYWLSLYKKDITALTVLKASWIVIGIAVLFGYSLRLAVFGTAALGAKFATGDKIDKCYRVDNFSSYRTVKIRLIDFETNKPIQLWYSSRLGNPSVAVGQSGMFSRVHGYKSWFGIDVVRIDADAKCDPKYSIDKKYNNVYITRNMSSKNLTQSESHE